ncbi:MAG TPA: C25 family cysteine peptidase [Anaerolineae bacterium]|nr:C25 family cysteine peptidase [Anaerolineae bacterium]
MTRPWQSVGRRRSPALALLAVLLVTLATLAAACTPPPPAPLARLTLRAGGIYRLDRADLKAAGLGWDAVDPRSLRLYADGAARPLWPDPATGGWPLLFAAEGPSSPDSEAGAAAAGAEDGRQVFLLAPGTAPAWLAPRPPVAPWPGRPTPASAPPWPPPPAAPEGAVWDELTLSERKVYEPLRPGGERWLGPRLTAPGTTDLAFDLPRPAPGAAQLGLWLRAETEAPADPDHRLIVALNGETVADWSWDGAGERRRWLDLPAGGGAGGLSRALQEGPNRLTLTLPGLPDVLAETLLLDRVVLRYLRPARPEADRLTWLATAPRLDLSGFSAAAAVWPLAGAGLLGPPLATADAGGTLRLDGLEAGLRHAAVGPAGAEPPESLTRAGEGPDLRRPAAGADWLAVAAPELMAELEPLAQRREAQGLRTALLASTWVYEQFGSGAADGAALEAFLRHAAAHWRPAPRYVLLAGDATEDPAGHASSPEGAMLATGWLFGTFGGWVPSDSVLTRDADGAPRGAAIGRIPARRPEELRAVLDKMARWEAAVTGDEAWRRRALVVADPAEPVFAEDAARFAQDLGAAVFLAEPAGDPDGGGAVSSGLGTGLGTGLNAGMDSGFNTGPNTGPKSVSPGTPVAPESPAVAAERVGGALRRALDDGLGLTVYIGHGSRRQWGRGRLLDREAAEALTNRERPGLVVNLSCLTGAFTHPTEPALAETLLLSARGGAAAVIAPSSLTLAADQAALAAALAAALGDPATARLGDALTTAWRAVTSETPGAREVALTFLLFGDPALKLRR